MNSSNKDPSPEYERNRLNSIIIILCASYMTFLVAATIIGVQNNDTTAVISDINAYKSIISRVEGFDFDYEGSDLEKFLNIEL